MARFARRFHHTRNHKTLHPLALVGICLGVAILVAIILGNLLNLLVKDTPADSLPENTMPNAPVVGNIPERTVPKIRSYPFLLGDSVDTLFTEGEQLLNSVSVSINHPDGTLNYRSDVASYQKLEILSDAELKPSMQDLTMTVPYVCGVFYPQIPDTEDPDLFYAAVNAEAALLREFIHAGGSEILIVGVSFESHRLPYLADYLNQLQNALGNAAVGLAIPWSVATSENGWELVPALRPLADYLALDLQAIPDDEMETALLNADYFIKQYDMRLILSSDQPRWISSAEATYDDYQIINVPPEKTKEKEALG